MDVPAARQALSELAVAKVSKRRILVFDIETFPAEAWVWQARDQYVSIDQIKSAGGVLCFAASWVGENKTMFYSMWDDGYVPMLEAAFKLLDEADVVVGWNIDRFDVQVLQGAFEVHDMGRPRPSKSVDLFKTCRKNFRWESAKLDYVARMLGIGCKVKHHGFALWPECMAGDAAARRLMTRYCKGDVVLTKKVLWRLWKWVTTLPHQGLYGGNRAGCPRCGSMDVEQDNYTVKMMGRYTLWMCRACQGYFEGSHRVESVHHKAV
jgi:DNA polymerase elongation subunit (family B)